MIIRIVFSIILIFIKRPNRDPLSAISPITKRHRENIMKSLFSPLFPNRLIHLGLLCLLILLIPACSSGPDESILEDRLAATVNLGWGWVKAENVSLEKKEDTETGIMGTFSYTLVIQKDAHLLPPEAIATFRTHVPQCRSVPIQKGKRCSLEETLLFVESSTFGWVPEIVVRQRPELLNYIANTID